MAGNGSRQKKSPLDHTFQFLSENCSKMQCSEKGSKSKKGTKNDALVTSRTSDNYVTWPSVKLRETIKETIYRLINSESSKPVLNIIDEVEQELNIAFPIETEEQLDFCMMCPQVDHIKAVELQTQLCVEYNLVGKVLWECVPLGRDLFNVIEDMLNNSTRVLYYVTNRFDDTDACAHVARNLLIEQDNKGADRKVIPLVADYDTPIPDTFELVDKLYLCNKLQFQYRFPAVFTEDMKLEKILRTENLKTVLDDKRKHCLQSLVQCKLRL